MSFFSKIKKFFSANLGRGKLAPYLLLFVGLVFCVNGGNFAYSIYEFKANSIDAKLKVIAVDEKISDNSLTYRPVFQRIDGDSLFTTYAGSLWMSPKPHEVGDVVDGRINVATGEMQSIAIIDGYKFMSIGFFIAGVIPTVIGGIWSWKRRKKKSTNLKA